MSNQYPVWSSERSRHWVWLEERDADAVSTGGVALCGQMLGVGEYEYAFSIQPADLPALWDAFGVPRTQDLSALAAAVRERYDEVREVGDRQWLIEHQVPYTFWSRVED